MVSCRHGVSISQAFEHGVLKPSRRCSSLGRVFLIVSRECPVPSSPRSEPQVSDVQVSGRLERSVASKGLGSQKLFIPLRMQG